MRAAESLEGGINRNSNPQAITTARHAYDRFLAKFPLLFGYWKKYADMEFSITGTEAAEMVRHILFHFLSSCQDLSLLRIHEGSVIIFRPMSLTAR